MTLLAILVLAACSTPSPDAAPPAARIELARSPDIAVPPESDALDLAAAEPLPTALLGRPGRPDRVATSPDGQWIAFVSGETGIASVWIISADGGEAVQLTNTGLQSAPHPRGQAPEGFVAPPHRGPLRFDDDELVWEAPDGPHRVRWQ